MASVTETTSHGGAEPTSHDGEETPAATKLPPLSPSTKPVAVVVGKPPPKTEAISLETETKALLGRTSRHAPTRAPQYWPSLAELTSVSFVDYVRGTLLGVELDQPMQDDGASAAAVGGTSLTGDESSTAAAPGPGSPGRAGGNGVARCVGGEAETEAKKDLALTEEATRTPDGGDRTKSAGASPASRSAKHNYTTRTACKRDLSVACKRDSLLRTAQVMHKDARHAVVSESPEVNTGVGEDGSSLHQSIPLPRWATLSDRRTMQAKVGSSTNDADLYCTDPRFLSSLQKTGPSAEPRTRRKPRPFRSGVISKVKFASGMARVTLPDGWWDRAGIGKDATGRGIHWRRGTKLGDMLITTPIKQCVSGIGGKYEFTMLELPSVSVADFREKADIYRSQQIGSARDEDISDEFLDDLARKFWRRLGPTMESSVYGADLEASLFEGAEASGWNIDRLESCLQLLRADAGEEGDDHFFRLPGVTTAYLYFGMWGSVFAAHTEDMNLLSINYLHAGAPKYWYSINPEDNLRFESLMASHYPEARRNCSEFLRHKRYLLSPSILTKAGIRYKTQVQRAGDAVISFPGCYHFGFNTGFNVAESTNFAVPEWVPMGDSARICLCYPFSVRIDMKRLKQLLTGYETEVEKQWNESGNTLSYLEWARGESQRLLQLRQSVVPPVATMTDTKKAAKDDESSFMVEVDRLGKKKASATLSPKRKNSGSRKRRRTKNNHGEGWRLAKRVKASTFTAQSAVLCFVACDEEDRTEKCCYGTISNIYDNYARIHFSGADRQEDVWVPLTSPRLFLDGGQGTNPAAATTSASKKAAPGKVRAR